MQSENNPTLLQPGQMLLRKSVELSIVDICPEGNIDWLNYWSQRRLRQQPLFHGIVQEVQWCYLWPGYSLLGCSGSTKRSRGSVELPLQAPEICKSLVIYQTEAYPGAQFLSLKWDPVSANAKRRYTYEKFLSHFYTRICPWDFVSTAISHPRQTKDDMLILPKGQK